MRSPFKRLMYFSAEDSDMLQEYFIPLGRASEFLDHLRTLAQKHRANLLNCTVRFINRSSATFLNYAKHDSLAFVLYLNVGKDQRSQENEWKLTQDLVDAALQLNGTFYLPYLPYYDSVQLKRAYPEIDQFFEAKRRYDPEEIFTNFFYEKYAKGAEWK